MEPCYKHITYKSRKLNWNMALLLPALNAIVPVNQHSPASVLAFSLHMHQPEYMLDVHQNKFNQICISELHYCLQSFCNNHCHSFFHSKFHVAVLLSVEVGVQINIRLKYKIKIWIHIITIKKIPKQPAISSLFRFQNGMTPFSSPLIPGLASPANQTKMLSVQLLCCHCYNITF